MTKTEKKVFLITNISVSIIGIVYYLLKNFFSIETQFGARPHPLTGNFLHLHILSVFPFVILFGYLLAKHIIPKLKSKSLKRKKSGFFILTLFLVMSLSGYILQVLIQRNSLIINTHLIISGLWIFLSFWHSRAN